MKFRQLQPMSKLKPCGLKMKVCARPSDPFEHSLQCSMASLEERIKKLLEWRKRSRSQKSKPETLRSLKPSLVHTASTFAHMEKCGMRHGPALARVAPTRELAPAAFREAERMTPSCVSFQLESLCMWSCLDNRRSPQIQMGGLCT